VTDDRAFPGHIRDAIARIESYTGTGRDAFLQQPMIQDAVIRNLEIIGEAVKHLSPGLRTANPEVDWTRIAGLRDVLIHGYFGVNLETVWNVVENRLPALKERVEVLWRAAES
jgi:uncharacterized protein with HEPN domain